MANEIYTKLKLDSKEFKSKIDAAKKDSQDLTDGIRSIGIASGVAFAAVSAAVFSTTKRFAQFENQMKGVKTLLDSNSFSTGTLSDGFEKMSDDLLELSKTVPVSLDNLTKSLFDTVSAGVDATEAVEVLGVSSKLAVAGLTDVTTATNGMTSAINAYGLGADDANEVASKFFTAQKLGKTTISELSNFFGLAASSSAAYGVSLDELLSAVSAATTGGIKTGQAFTGVNAILSNIAKPTAEAAKEAKRLGVEFNFAAIKSQGLAGFLGSLTESSGFTDESIVKLFGSVEAQKLAFSLTGAQADAFAKSIETLGNKEQTLKTFTDAANEQLDSLENNFELLGKAIEVAGIKLGEEFAPAANDATKAVTTLINTFSEDETLVDFAGNLILIGGAATGLIAIVAAVGLGAVGLSLALGGVITTGGALLAILGTAGSAVGLAGALTWIKGLFEESDKAAKEYNNGELSNMVTKSSDLKIELDELLKTQDKFPSSSQKINKSRGDEITKINEQITALDDLIRKKEQETQTSAPLLGANYSADPFANIFDEALGNQKAFTAESLLVSQEKNDAEINQLKDLVEKKKIIGEEERLYNQEMKMLDKEIANIDIEEAGIKKAETVKRFEEQERLIKLKAQAKQLADNKKFGDALGKLKIARFKQDIENDKLAVAQKEIAEKQKFNTQVAWANQGVAAAQAAANIMTAVGKGQSKAAFLLAKGAAVAQATISAIVASNLALANPPGPPTTIPLSNAILGIGLANAAAIGATALQGFATGGLVTGGTPNRDSVPIMAQEGELITPKKNFDETVNAVADRRNDEQTETSGMMDVLIGFTDDAFEIIERKLVERQALGISNLG